jgi:hypothetical protein
MVVIDSSKYGWLAIQLPEEAELEVWREVWSEADMRHRS